MTLDDAIATLYAREINCGCETFWDGGIKVWIGDVMNGHQSTPTRRAMRDTIVTEPGKARAQKCSQGHAQ